MYKGEKQNSFIIIGKLIRTRWARETPPGHVDLFIHSSEWDIKKRLSVNFRPRILKKNGVNMATFTVQSISGIPAGSMIHAAFHEFKKNTDIDIFDCGNNKADPENF